MDASTRDWPSKLRYGSVVAVMRVSYDALTVKWGGWEVGKLGRCKVSNRWKTQV